jgi:dihydrofolate synthase/folylpolyglutamate synthase
MKDNYNDSINYLYGLQKYGIKLGLEKTSRILSAAGSPQNNFKSVHIAGTNGKGSVSAMVASILMSNGFKVGLFTSPHLVSFTERITVNGVQITESEVVHLTEEIKSIIASLDVESPTFFEFVTAMAFLYFSRKNIDWGVIEVGMGGRLDCTNVIIPEASVITRISYDHKEFLGDTLTAIAGEKAGIIKNGIPVISSAQEKEAEDVIVKTASERSSHLYLYGRDFEGLLNKSDLNGIVFDYIDSSLQTPASGLYTPLAGEHQLINSCVAVKAASVLLQKTTNRTLHNADFEAIRKGLSATRWRGRLEIASKNPLIIIDGAHNPDAATKLSQFLKKEFSQYRIILVTGIMSDKDMPGILKPLMPICHEIIFTSPNYGRAASPQTLHDLALKEGFDSRTAPSVREALKMALEIGKSWGQGVEIKNGKPLILITGSFYTIGEAMEALGEKAVLGDLREKL